MVRKSAIEIIQGKLQFRTFEAVKALVEIEVLLRLNLYGGQYPAYRATQHAVKFRVDMEVAGLAR